MDISTILFAILTITLACVTVHARRPANEQRGVARLGASSGRCGMGTTATTIL